MAMKEVRYLPDAIRALRRHGNMASRMRDTVTEYAADPAVHANNSRALVGTDFVRVRVGDDRVIFEETETTIIVIKIGRRGSVHE